MHSIHHIVDFEAKNLNTVFNEVICQELQEFTNFKTISEIVSMSYDMRLPYDSFWGAVNNILLL